MMKTKSPTAQRNGLIAARASTQERMLAEQLAVHLGLKSQSDLVRSLITTKAKALNLI